MALRVHLHSMRTLPTVQFTPQLRRFTATYPGDGGTTGGLWSSDDGGDRCLRVVALPPPMYAVRFG